MKLRNKKTGAIYSIEDIDLGNNKDGIWVGLTLYNSLAEFYDEWEDYDEDKRYWYIDNDGEVMLKELAWFNDQQIEIGNYFETKEEAEKTVEKLEAWKRLKNNGAEFYGWRRNQTGTYELYLRWEDRIPRSYEIKKDIDLLFGSEE